MAVLRQGSVISATVEQSLGNCLLISFKHRSRTFRGVLFDERNSSVSRITASKPSNESTMLVNKSSLPLGTAIVSPSRQSYSGLRNRTSYNTNSKRSGSSSTKSTSSKSNDSRRNSGLKSTFDQAIFGGKEGGSFQGQRKPVNGNENGTENRHSARLLRQKSLNSSENGVGVKRKAEKDLVSSKPVKSRATGQHSTGSQNTTRNGSKSHKKSTLSKPNIEQSETKVSVSINSVLDKIVDKSECNIDPDSSLKLDGDQFTKIKHDLFPNDNTSNDNNVFCNDQVDYQCNPVKKDLNNFDENDTVTAFFGSLGLGRKGSSSDKDDASIATDSGTSSSSDILFVQHYNAMDTDIDLHSKQDTDSSNDGINTKEQTDKQLILLTPTKKSARISAKRAILEKNIDNDHDETTIWSIWGGLPAQNKAKNKQSLSEEGLHIVHTHEDNVNISPESLSSCEFTSAHEFDQSQPPSNKVKGPRMKQTPVRIKKPSSTVVQPEKQVSVGNVVWGKVHGHPWWPGRVLAVSGNIDEGNEVIQHAHVTWFGSNTSSIMPVNELQHFLANFKRRFKRTKKGCYRKAVKQAQEMIEIMGEI